MNKHQEKLFEWEAPRIENERIHKITQIGLLVLIMFISFWAYNYFDKLLAIITFFGTIMIWVLKREEYPTTSILINKFGVEIDGEEVPFTKISTFWIQKNENGKYYLLLKLKNQYLFPTKLITLSDKIDVKLLRAFLKKYLFEKKTREYVWERLVNRI